MSITNDPNNIHNLTPPSINSSETAHVEKEMQLPAPLFADQVSVADYTPEQRNQAAVNVPSLSPPDQNVDPNFNVGKALDENPWFSNNALVVLSYVMQELQKVNRDSALELGFIEASLTQFLTDANKEVAKYTKESFEAQMKMAMFEMAGAIAGLAMSTASLGITVGGGIAGGLKARSAAGEQPAGTATQVDAQGIPIKEATGKTPPLAQKGFWEGAADGVRISSAIGEPIGQMGGNINSIITNAGKIQGLNEQGEAERAKILAQAEADLIKKALETVEQESKYAMEHNDQIRSYLKSVSEERARLFGSITGH